MANFYIKVHILTNVLNLNYMILDERFHEDKVMFSNKI